MQQRQGVQHSLSLLEIIFLSLQCIHTTDDFLDSNAIFAMYTANGCVHEILELQMIHDFNIIIATS